MAMVSTATANPALHQMCMNKYNMLVLRLNRCNDARKVINAIEFYYDNCDLELKEQAMLHINDHTFQAQKSLLKTLIKEVINRDMINYVQTGDETFPLCMQVNELLK